jgi:hypothetical protein
MAPVSLHGGKMWYEITSEPGYLRAALFGRQTPEETQGFLKALAAESRKRRCPRILISVHQSKAIFTVGKYGLPSSFDDALRLSARIAVLGDTEELRISHQYVESLAAQHGVDLRAFREEADALKWLMAGYVHS